MKQVWLIFGKDVRHLWPELSVYALLLGTLAMVAPQVQPEQDANQAFALFTSLPKMLIVACWLVVIARVVHADNLLGEEQFWITRPYRWQALLGAKVLFIAVCVAVPFVLMQWWVLLAAGLNPFSDIAGMSLTLLRLAVQVWLPLFVAASVTEHLAMMFSVVAAALVTWLVLLMLGLSGTEARMSPPYSMAVMCVLFGGLLTSILVYQYAKRKTVHSRWAIAGVVALFVLVLLGYERGGFGEPVKQMIRSHYPKAESLHLVFLGSAPYDERGEDMDAPKDMMEVKLPVRIDGLTADTKLRETHVAVEMEGGGVHYAPPWERAVVGEHTLGFLMPKDVFDRLAGADAKVHLELVAEEWRPAHVREVKAAARFDRPMNGVCSLVETKVYCRYPYREWVPTRVEAMTCGGMAVATLRHVPAGMVLDPVVVEALPFKGKVCLGDVVRFTEYGMVGRFRLVMDVDGMRVGGYRGR